MPLTHLAQASPWTNPDISGMELSSSLLSVKSVGKALRSALPDGRLWLSTLWAELLEKSIIAELEGLGGSEFFRALEGDIKGPQI